MALKLTDKERKKIINYLKDGKSQNWTAQKVNRSPSTINEIAKTEGLTNIRAPKKAVWARRHFAKEDRLALIGYALDRGGELLQLELTPQQYQQVMTGIAIGVDKHRLETGDVTDRTERVDAEARDRVRSKLDELEQRREARL